MGMYLLLFLCFVIWNGRVTVEVLLVGAVLVAAIGLLFYRLTGYTPKKELRYLRKVPLFCCYLGVLLVEIIKANFSMMAIVLKKSIPIEPALVTFHCGLKTGFGRFMLANSITLTPGTITVGVEGDALTVHCLSPRFLDTGEDAVFIRWIRRLEQ